MRRATQAAGLAAVGGAAVAGLMLYSGSGRSSLAASESYDLQLQATPREIDEGDLVEFVSSLSFIDDETGTIEDARGVISSPLDVEHRWDFGDGSDPAVGLDLREYNHRFVDGGPDFTPYRVTLRAGGLEESVVIIVNNVAPTIHNIRRSRPARQGEPVTFEATVTDPGRDDALTFDWDFGDGGTGQGRSVSHTFESDGVYDVTLTVRDGDDGEAQDTIQVPVGNVGSFTVSGDISIPDVEVERVVLVGTKPRGGEGCQLRLEMSPSGGGPTLTLTAVLEAGLGQRDYAISSQTLWNATSDGRERATGVFFGDLGLPRAYERIMRGTMRVHGPFWSREGKVSVDYFDGKHVELSYETNMVENIPGTLDPRMVRVQGTLAKQVTGGAVDLFSAIGSGALSLYMCGRDDTETFDIASATPAENAEHAPFVNPEISITFTRPLDPDTVFGNLQLDHRLAGPGVMNYPVEGTWELVPGDERSVRFVPQAHLMDGVHYCVRVHAGEDGLRGRDGEILEPDMPNYAGYSAGACTAQPWPGQSRDWTFATRPELRDVHVDLYQVSHVGANTLLVPAKPTVARVYADWQRSAVHPDAQVKAFTARVSVKGGGRNLYPPKKVRVSRPDTFSDEDRRHARNTTNFFDWRPAQTNGSMTVQPVVELMNFIGWDVLHRVEGRTDRVGFWDRAKVLKVDYYYMGVDAECADTEPAPCDWSNYIDSDWRSVGRWVMQGGAVFTTQNFPVVETQARMSGDLAVTMPSEIRPCEGWDGSEDDDCVNAGTARQEFATSFLGNLLFEAGRATDADILVGLVPPKWGRRWAGVMATLGPSGKRIVLLQLGEVNHVAVPHEFGHHFDLDHCPAPSGACAFDIQGFRVDPSGRSGFNKQQDEGNQEGGDLRPVMQWNMQPVNRAFMRVRDYETLFDTIASAVLPADVESARRWPRRAWPDADRPGTLERLATLWGPLTVHAQQPAPPAPSGRLRVQGLVTGDAVMLQRVAHEPAAPPPARPAEAGDATLDLLDAEGAVLASYPMALRTSADDGHGPPARHARFYAEVPAPAGLRVVRVRAPERTPAERARSAQPPAVRAEVASQNGTRTLRWTASDPDGDALRTSVYLRADGEGPWRGVAIDLTTDTLTLDRHRLPPGQQVTARVAVSDGFDVTTTEVDVGEGAPMGVSSLSPADGASDVAVTTHVTAYVSTPLRRGGAGRTVSLDTGRFELTDAQGTKVFADALYQPGTGLLMLVPNQDLRPGTRYTATLEGLRDVWGNTLAEPVMWRFETAGEPPP